MITSSKSLFVLAAIFNFMGGLLLLFFGQEVFEFLALSYNVTEQFITGTAVLVLLFAFIFLLIARAPEYHRFYINLSILAKVLFAAICIGLMITSSTNYWVLFLAGIDLFFANQFYREIKMNY